MSYLPGPLRRTPGPRQLRIGDGLTSETRPEAGKKLLLVNQMKVPGRPGWSFPSKGVNWP
jgi:hypothetical protein